MTDMTDGDLGTIFDRAYETHLAAAVVRVVQRRAKTEPKLIEHLLDRPGWALADELRRLAKSAPMPWWRRVLVGLVKRVLRPEPHWMRIAEAVRAGLTSAPL